MKPHSHSWSQIHKKRGLTRQLIAIGQTSLLCAKYFCIKLIIEAPLKYATVYHTKHLDGQKIINGNAVFAIKHFLGDVVAIDIVPMCRLAGQAIKRSVHMATYHRLVGLGV